MGKTVIECFSKRENGLLKEQQRIKNDKITELTRCNYNEKGFLIEEQVIKDDKIIEFMRYFYE